MDDQKATVERFDALKEDIDDCDEEIATLTHQLTTLVARCKAKVEPLAKLFAGDPEIMQRSRDQLEAIKIDGSSRNKQALDRHIETRHDLIAAIEDTKAVLILIEDDSEVGNDDAHKHNLGVLAQLQETYRENRKALKRVNDTLVEEELVMLSSQLLSRLELLRSTIATAISFDRRGGLPISRINCIGLNNSRDYPHLAQALGSNRKATVKLIKRFMTDTEALRSHVLVTSVPDPNVPSGQPKDRPHLTRVQVHVNTS